MKLQGVKLWVTWLASLLIVTAITENSRADFEISAFIDNFENNDKQSVLAGPIDSLVLERGPARFELRSGNLTLADFGCDRPLAMVFRGRVKFTYQPLDAIECYQLHKFTGQDTMICEFDDITFFWTVPPEGLPDVSLLSRQKINEDVWKKIKQAQKDAFDNLEVYLPSAMVGDLVSDSKVNFFYADLRIEKYEHLVFFDNPQETDRFVLYKLRLTQGIQTYDVYGAFSPAEADPAPIRGQSPINITHFEINSFIENNFKMQVKCRIYFVPTRGDRNYIYLRWHNDNRPKAAVDWNGISMQIVNTKNETGLGLVLNEPLIVGGLSYIDIEYECRGLKNMLGVFFIKSLFSWYPSNMYRDEATFDVTFNCPEDYEVIGCGDQVEARQEDHRKITRWNLDYPAEFYSFNVGIFDIEVVPSDSLPTVKIYLSKNMGHDEMLSRIKADISGSLSFFTYLFGACPFNEIKAADIPWSYGGGSPGIVHLSWLNYQLKGMPGNDVQFRAQEVSRQWWGSMVSFEKYSDYWIIEGLTLYCGLLYHEVMAQESEQWQGLLADYRSFIHTGYGGGSMGTMAGPLTLGHRLNSSKSDDYEAICYAKAAYVFHMLRYLMHDYNKNSDDKFIASLRDLLDKYRDVPITTERLQGLVEENTQTDLSWFFNQWVYGIDTPTYDFSYKSSQLPDGKYQVVCHVRQHDVPDGFMMVVPLKVIFENGQFAQLKTWVDQPEQDITLPILPMEPKKIEFNTCGAVLCEVNYK